LQEDNGITKVFGPATIGDGLVINAFDNISDISFIATSDLYTVGETHVLIGVGLHPKLFDKAIFGHNSLPSIIKLPYYIKSRFKKFGIT